MPAKQTQSDLGPTRADSGPAGNSGATASAIRRRRAPSADAAEAPAPTAKQVEATATATAAGRPRLLTWDELPAWRRDNAFIHAGYRATSHSYRRSLQSLAYLHNESVNIWTHLLGAVGFAAAAAVLRRAVAARYAAASAADTLVFACFFAGAASCLGMSAAFHALSNHSDAVARWGNKLDYSGIVFLIVGSYVPALYYGFFCVPTRMTVSLYTIFVLGMACLCVSWFEHFRTPEWRPWRTLIFVGLGVSGVGPIIYGVLHHGFTHFEDRMGLSWVILQGFLYLFGAFLYAIRWPERQFPGRVDIWGNSHQIFHVFILCAAAAHLYGMLKAFDYHHSVMGAQCST